MADTSLADYFNIAPSDTTWGIGQNALAQALPLLMRTRGTTNQQFGTALGMSLVSALLGYQARRSAAEQSLQAAEIGSQLIGMQTPQERLALIKGVDSSNVQQNLLGLNARIGEQELQNQLIQRQKVGELTTNAEFALGDLGTKLFERETQAAINKALAVAGATAARTKQQLPTGVQTAITEASTFADAAKVQRDRIAKMDPLKLKTILTTGVNLGESGFNQANEAVIQIYRKANFGATLTGQEKKATDIITGKSLTATKADIVSAWDTLIDLNNKRAQRTVEVATSSPEQLTQMFGTGAKTETPGGESEAAKKNRELKERLTRLEALATQRK